MKRLLVLLLALVFACQALSGQAQVVSGPPPGGYLPAVVAALARVPLPPGGLIPYRRGDHWGYADTTGRVVVAPVMLREPFFMEEQAGFTHASLAEIPLFLNSEAAGSYPWSNLKKEFVNCVGIMNGRGEILLLTAQQDVPLLLPDGSLQAGRRQQHGGEPMLTPLYSPEPGRRSVAGWATVLVPSSEPRRRAEHQQLLQRPLGPNRYAYQGAHTRVQWLHRWRRHRYQLWRRVAQGRFEVLADSAGHYLTGAKYQSINPFHENRALAEVYYTRPGPTGRQPPRRRFVYLDRRGHEATPVPAEATSATDFVGGTALVWVTRRIDYYPSYARTGGIIDTLGRVLLPLTSALSNPDESGLLRCREASGPADSITRFLTRQGRPAFAGNSVFRRAGPFYNGRAWAEALDGRQGLLNRRGEWVTPKAYDLLGSATKRYFNPQTGYRPTYRHDNTWVNNQAWLSQGGWPSDNDAPADTAYMLARRAGHYGWVARRTGREVIPARYDSVIFHLSGGVACAVRAGQGYVVTAQGRELAQATYRGDWYDYPGRPLHLFRPAEGRWSVMDTSGCFRLPWLSGTGFLTPEGRAVVQEAKIAGQENLSFMDGQREYPCTGIVDAQGHVVLPFDDGIGYSGSYASLHLASMQAVSYPPFYLRSDQVSQLPSQVYRLSSSSGYQLLAAADFQPFTPGSFAEVNLLANGWHIGYRATDSLTVLIDPAGRQVAAPRGTRWERYYQRGSAQNQTPPFANGIEKVRYGSELGGPYESAPSHYGYLTRWGRRLWTE